MSPIPPWPRQHDPRTEEERRSDAYDAYMEAQADSAEEWDDAALADFDRWTADKENR